MTRPSSSAATDRNLVAPSRVLAGFALSEKVIALLDGYLGDLVEILPALNVRRGFNSGAWRIGAHRAGVPVNVDARARSDGAVSAADTPAPEHRPNVSRIDFELRVDGDRERVDLTARTTLRGHDRRPERFSTHMDSAGREALREWIETSLMEFTDSYVSGRHATSRGRSN